MRIPDSWRLSFPDASLEAEYRRAYWHHWVPYARVGLVSAAFLGAAFSLLDHLVVGYAIGALSIIRFCILVPTILIGFLLSFFRATSSKYHLVIIVCVIIVGLCIISMIAIIEPPAADYYYAGLIMVLFFNYTLLQLRLTHAIAAGFILVVLYEILAVFVLEIPNDALINNTFFVVSTTYGGVFACYTIERSRRKNFEQFITIENERRKLQEMADRLQDLSCRDEMTGLLNRRRLSDCIRSAAERFQNKGESSALMLIDVDDFKGINDHFGHDVGDDVLVGVAAAIRETLRGRGSAFRYGGDEFLVLLPGMAACEGAVVAGTVRTAIEQHSLLTGLGCQLQITVSIGITEVASPRDTLRAVMEIADAALYSAKKQGKGRIVTKPRSDPRIGRIYSESGACTHASSTKGEDSQADLRLAGSHIQRRENSWHISSSVTVQDPAE